MGNGIQASETRIYIVSANVNGSALASSDRVIGEIENYSQSGGEQDIESVPTFGDGTTQAFLDKEKARTQLEISFDVYVNNAAASTLDRWDIYKYGSGGTSITEGDSKAIFIESLTGGLIKTTAMNNCRAVTWEPGQSADDMMKGTMTFKFSPATAAAAANLKTSALSSSSAFFNWD